jgi:hypothetical protein
MLQAADPSAHSFTVLLSEPSEEIERAEGLIRDAERCKLLLPALHECASPRDPALCPLQGRLAHLAADLEAFLAAHVDASLKVTTVFKTTFSLHL